MNGEAGLIWIDRVAVVPASRQSPSFRPKRSGEPEPRDAGCCIERWRQRVEIPDRASRVRNDGDFVQATRYHRRSGRSAAESRNLETRAAASSAGASVSRFRIALRASGMTGVSVWNEGKRGVRYGGALLGCRQPPQNRARVGAQHLDHARLAFEFLHGFAEAGVGDMAVDVDEEHVVPSPLPAWA